MSLLLVHLVRAGNGPRPLERFLDSYLAHPPGAEHELLLVLKGFASEADAEPLVGLARERGIEPRLLAIDDHGVDLSAYARVVAEVPADRYCFVNSFSRALAGDWLERLDGALDDPSVGVAGATGSWASHQDYRRYQLGLRSGYDTVFDSREGARLAFLELTRVRDPGKRDNGRLAHAAAAAIHMLRDRGAFERFPSMHLRTNAFAVSRTTLIEIGLPVVGSKRDAYRLESGPGSLTHRVQRAGLRAVVAGRDGQLYDSDSWPESLTLWQGSQQNLLVADNQTDDYERAGPPGRRALSQLAWGQRARPG